MKYLCLAYYDVERYASLPRERMAAIGAQCAEHDRALRESGGLVMVASLAEPAQAKSIRPRDGKPWTTDGPFTETKEQVGAFFLIEAPSADEAVRIASLHPAARLGAEVGWGIEVREIGYFDQPAKAA